jgi:hypothetical protein
VRAVLGTNWARRKSLFDLAPNRMETPPVGRNDARQARLQDDAATVGSFGFKVTTSLWHLSRVSNPRTAEIGSLT